MKLIERVFYSIKEKPVKSLLILLVVCLLGTFMSASFSIYQANNNLMYNIRKKSSAIILIDWEYKDKDYHLVYENKKNEIIDKYKTDERFKFIENRYLINNGNMHFQLLDNQNKPFDLYDRTIFAYENENSITELSGLMILIGIDNHLISDVYNQNLSVEIGRTFTEEEMKIGAKVAFYTSDKKYNKVAEEYLKEMDVFHLPLYLLLSNGYDYNDILIHTGYELNLENIGSGFPEKSTDYKYHGNSNGTSLGLYIPSKLMDEISEKMIKIRNEIGDKYQWYKNQENFEDYGKKYVIETYIELNDAEQLNKIVREIEKDTNGLVKGVYSFNDSYNDIKNINKNLNTIAIVSLIVCVIASIILLSLIFQIFVRERRHEIGIFISLGESKKNIIKQILLEVLIIGMLGISLSVFSGHMIGKGLSENLLNNQLKQHAEIYEEGNATFEITQEEIKENYQVNITYEYVISVYAGGLVVLVLSCIYPTRSILKMKARKMLM